MEKDKKFDINKVDWAKFANEQATNWINGCYVNKRRFGGNTEAYNFEKGFKEGFKTEEELFKVIAKQSIDENDCLNNMIELYTALIRMYLYTRNEYIIDENKSLNLDFLLQTYYEAQPNLMLLGNNIFTLFNTLLGEIKQQVYSTHSINAYDDKRLLKFEKKLKEFVKTGDLTMFDTMDFYMEQAKEFQNKYRNKDYELITKENSQKRAFEQSVRDINAKLDKIMKERGIK